MKWAYNDGGRSKYFKGSTDDCVTRAVAIATGLDYKKVYDMVNNLAENEYISKHQHKFSSARTGVRKNTCRKLLEQLGWHWHACSGIGKGCTMHLTENEIPNGIIICALARHYVCVKNKVINDTWDSSTMTYYDEYGNLVINNNRCVYGYYTKD
jgi:hypothetical protein